MMGMESNGHSIPNLQYHKLRHGFWEARPFEGRVSVIRASLDMRPIVDLFYERSAMFIEECEAQGHPVLYLHELGSLGFSDYSRQKAKAFMQAFRHIEGRGAYVFQKSAQVSIARAYVLNTLPIAWPNLEIREFPSVPLALSWLQALT